MQQKKKTSAKWRNILAWNKVDSGDGGSGGGLKEYVCSLLTCHNLEELCTAAVALVLCMYMYVYVFISDHICNVIAY